MLAGITFVHGSSYDTSNLDIHTHVEWLFYNRPAQFHMFHVGCEATYTIE